MEIYKLSMNPLNNIISDLFLDAEKNVPTNVTLGHFPCANNFGKSRLSLAKYETILLMCHLLLFFRCTQLEPSYIILQVIFN